MSLIKCSCTSHSMCSIEPLLVHWSKKSVRFTLEIIVCFRINVVSRKFSYISIYNGGSKWNLSFYIYPEKHRRKLYRQTLVTISSSMFLSSTPVKINYNESLKKNTPEILWSWKCFFLQCKKFFLLDLLDVLVLSNVIKGVSGYLLYFKVPQMCHNVPYVNLWNHTKILKNKDM